MKIYIASKTIHGNKWKELREKGLPIISTWIDECGIGETKDWLDLWERCIKEASEADLLIVYREPNEILKGAWVEVGAALARNKLVYAVNCEEFSIKNHRNVICFKTLEEVLDAAGF